MRGNPPLPQAEACSCHAASRAGAARTTKTGDRVLVEVEALIEIIWVRCNPPDTGRKKTACHDKRERRGGGTGGVVLACETIVRWPAQ